LLFGFARARFFLKWKGHFSFWGSALQVFGQCGGAFNSDSVLRKLFSGDMDFRKTETNLFFAFCPRGGGVWGGIRAGFLFFMDWDGVTEKIRL
jgi:hypothetical protein